VTERVPPRATSDSEGVQRFSDSRGSYARMESHFRAAGKQRALKIIAWSGVYCGNSISVMATTNRMGPKRNAKLMPKSTRTAAWRFLGKTRGAPR